MADSSTSAQIDYLARDFAGYRQALLSYASRVFPEWTNRNPADFGVMFVELFSYLGDIVSFYQDAIADECFLATATQRDSVVAIARMLGYTPHAALPAIGTVTVALADATKNPGPITVPAGTRFLTAFNDDLDTPVFYESDADVIVPDPKNPDPPSIDIPVTEGTTQGTRNVSAYGAAADKQGVHLVEDLGISTGLPWQSYKLAHAPALGDTVRVFVESGQTGPDGLPEVTEWQYTDAFVTADSYDRVFGLYIGDDGTASVSFGDGVNGAIPPTGLVLCVAYRTGGGAYGNVKANSIVDFTEPIAGLKVTASAAMTGGADRESIEQIRVNAPKVFRAQNRAVSLRDYADIALSVPGIAKANAVAKSSTSITVFVMGANNNVPSQLQRETVQKKIQAVALAGTTVTVAPGVLVKVNIGTTDAPIQVGVAARFKRGDVALAVRKSLAAALGPTGTDLGMRLSLSNVYAAVEATPGVLWSRIDSMVRADITGATGTDDILFRPWEMPEPGDIEITTIGGAV